MLQSMGSQRVGHNLAAEQHPWRELLFVLLFPPSYQPGVEGREVQRDSRHYFKRREAVL